MEYEFQAALDTLKSWGIELVMGKYPLEFSGYFAGTDAQKIEDLLTGLRYDILRQLSF